MKGARPRLELPCCFGNKNVPTNREETASFDRNHVQQFRLQLKLAEEMRDAIQEALQDLGHETAEMILLYARTRRNVDARRLPLGIEDLDSVLYETLETGRRMIVNRCATLLSERIGRVIRRSQTDSPTCSGEL